MLSSAVEVQHYYDCVWLVRAAAEKDRKKKLHVYVNILRMSAGGEGVIDVYILGKRFFQWNLW